MLIHIKKKEKKKRKKKKSIFVCVRWGGGDLKASPNDLRRKQTIKCSKLCIQGY